MKPATKNELVLALDALKRDMSINRRLALISETEQSRKHWENKVRLQEIRVLALEIMIEVAQ